MFGIILCSALCLAFVNGEVTLELAKDAAYTSDTIYIGQKNKLKLTATFDPSTTTGGVVIELLPSVTSTIFALGDIISYTEGASLTTTSGTTNVNFKDKITTYPGSDQPVQGKISYNTRAVLNLGSVTSAAGSGATLQIVIVYEVVYVSIGSNADGAEYWTSAGMEFGDGQYIWISQISYILKSTSATVTETPSFNISTGADANIAIGDPKVVTLSMSIPHPKATLTVESLVVNDTKQDVFVHKMRLITVGNAYIYSLKKDMIITTGFDSCPLKTSMTLDFGTIINKESSDANSNKDYLLVVEIVYQVLNPNLVGKTFTLGFGIDISGNEVWVGDFQLTVTTSTPKTLTSLTLSPGAVTPSAGYAGYAMLSFNTPEKSMNNYTIVMNTTGKLSILSLNPISYGNNMPCAIPDTALYLEMYQSTSDVYDSAVLTVNISNTGMQSPALSNSSTVTFQVYVLMMPDAVQGETATLKAGVNGNAAGTVTFTTGASVPYPTNVNYTFTLENDCTTKFQAGSTLAYRMKVVTQRSITAGPMTIETPIPQNLTASNLTFKSANVISKGKNVVCVKLGPIVANLSDWTTNSGENDRAVLTVPLVCNVQLLDNVSADEFVVEVKVVMEDVPAYLSADTTDEFGIGVKFSGNQIWVASSTFDTKTPVNLTVSKKVTGVKINTTEAPLASDLRLQWSEDNVHFHDFAHTWDAGTTVSTTVVYKQNKTLYAKYVRLVNTDGKCNPGYTLETTAITDNDITFHGTIASKDKMMDNVMFVLDDNVTTCMPLPKRTATSTAPYYWMTINTTVLGLNGTSPFDLQISGDGLKCNSNTGPQVTKVLYRSNADTLKFEGKRKRCQVKTYSAPTKCVYTCQCSDAVTCGDVSVLMYEAVPGSITGQYKICDVKAIPL